MQEIKKWNVPVVTGKLVGESTVVDVAAVAEPIAKDESEG